MPIWASTAESSRTPCRILGGANIVRMGEARRCILFRANSERLSGPHNQGRKYNDSGGDARYAVRTTQLGWYRTSQPDSLYLTECNLVLCPVIELGCSRRLMPCHLLGVLESSVVLQINRDAGCSPGVTSKG